MKKSIFIAPSEVTPLKYFVFQETEKRDGTVETIELSVKVTTDLRVINHHPEILKLNATIRKQIIRFHQKYN